MDFLFKERYKLMKLNKKHLLLKLFINRLHKLLLDQNINYLNKILNSKLLNQILEYSNQ